MSAFELAATGIVTIAVFGTAVALVLQLITRDRSWPTFQPRELRAHRTSVKPVGATPSQFGQIDAANTGPDDLPRAA